MGQGYNLNLPLKIGTGDDGYLLALEVALERIRRFDPGCLWSRSAWTRMTDRLGSLKLTTDGFGEIARRLQGFAFPLYWSRKAAIRLRISQPPDGRPDDLRRSGLNERGGGRPAAARSQPLQAFFAIESFSRIRPPPNS